MVRIGECQAARTPRRSARHPDADAAPADGEELRGALGDPAERASDRGRS